ncbi:MAG: histidinol dehydrogenase [Planctomycetaceae bacterium]|nr:histidinol dehydrogenase [Planctomycetaceae bacterium]
MASETLDIQRIDTRSTDWVERIERLREQLSPRGDVVSEQGRERTIEVFGEPLSPQRVVERICRDVRDQGVGAVLQYGRQLDGAELTADTLRVPSEVLANAHQRVDAEFLQTVRRIRANILEFQTALLQQDVEVRRADGTRLRQRYLPLRRVGVCVPGGAAAYPSTVLMTAVLAQAAGVAEIAVVAPPTEFGANNTDMLATCHELGIKEVYRVGGAQAVSALAYGAGPIARVDKIVGPGNLFVALAKKWVYGEVDIDAIAGPSEVVVIADGSTRPDYTAADMLAQAEHAPGASLLITWDERQRDAVASELERQVAGLSRSDLTLQSLESFAALILVRDAEEACRLTNLIAPEHLHIAVDDTGPLLAQIESAGAIFLGHHSPVAVGDYVAGPSHVLPTGGTARWAAGLSANDFLRGGSIIEYSPTGLAEIAGDVRMMADKEGLTAHRGSVDIRCS